MIGFSKGESLWKTSILGSSCYPAQRSRAWDPCLFFSERQLRNKRREFEQFKLGAKPVNPPTESQRSETQSPKESIAKNEELVKEIASLSNRLEESQRASDERENEQRHLLSVQSENQQLQEDLGRLRNQFEISETRLKESNNQIQEVVDLSAMLRKEIVELKQQLAERETAIETLQDAAQNAGQHYNLKTNICRNKLPRFEASSKQMKNGLTKLSPSAKRSSSGMLNCKPVLPN